MSFKILNKLNLIRLIKFELNKMGNLISYVSNSAYIYYSKISNLCTRKKNKKFVNNLNETPIESLLSESSNDESQDEIKIKFKVDKGENYVKDKISNTIKNEYQLLKNSEEYDYKSDDRDIENLSKEINDIKIIEEKPNKLNKDEIMDLDSLDDLKKKIFDRNEIYN